ncbi:mannose-6-phosphate isomerase, class I [Marinilactibacillus kalidii]|uniref:mannose-6-phosphate isomerase, class I n=1 Tax=Marinilactibacillus kalidii TaxID=2820274 RepID=UPI001ABDB730|nr:mannose-6-phosphate isomerase, class I [Marinilactibacillus kalidii]
MIEPLFLAGVMQEKIWGGTNLRDLFGYSIPSDHTGELWAISAHKNGPATIINGPYKNQTLTTLWDQHRELFGNQSGEVFPLLTKILDAQSALSVQVHPDDAYGMEHEGELGKTECWYVIDASEDAEIVFGHHAHSKEAFSEMIEQGKWNELLRYVQVKAGDFFYVPSGTIHAIGGGITILETQQSSDTTYRVYDYDRKDDSGQTRPLHIKQSIDVTTIPHVDPNPERTVAQQENAVITTFVDNEFFKVQEWKLNGHATFEAEGLYTLVSVLNGDGTLLIGEQKYPITKGSHFILPNGIDRWTVEGSLQIIASIPGDRI